MSNLRNPWVESIRQQRQTDPEKAADAILVLVDYCLYGKEPDPENNPWGIAWPVVSKEARQRFSGMTREEKLRRQREGIAIAKEQGKYKGRKPIDVDPEQLKAVCERWRAGQMTARAAMKELGLKSNTFYRKVKEAGL